MFIALVAAAAAFIAITSVFAWAGGLMTNPMDARLARMAPASSGTATKAPFSDRVFIPVLDSLVNAVVQLLPHTFVTRISRQLLAAGSPISSQAFFTFVVISAALTPVAALFVATNIDGGPAGVDILAVACGAAAGLLAPFLWLRRRVRSRKLAVTRRLADVFDMVTVCVEAGLGLDAALRQVSAKLTGPLCDEVSFTLRQVGMGRPRREALEDMGYRIDVPEVTTFVNAVIQAEQLGTSLGRVLRAQSQTLRIHRRQKAEELARRAPVKMVFPLVLFIMPTFFIVTIGPMFVHLVNYLND